MFVLLVPDDPHGSSPGGVGRSEPFLVLVVTLLEAPDVGLLPEISEIVTSDPRWFVLRTSRDQIPILIDPERVTPRCLKALAATLRDLRDRDRRVLVLDARYRGQVIVRCAPDSLGEVPAARDKV